MGKQDFEARSAGFLANQLARLMSAALADALRPLDLAPAQFATLLQLWDSDDLTQRDLVERLQVEQATMAGTLNRMERDGLITREPHKQDSRAQAIALTLHGRALQGPALRAATEVNQMALAALAPQEQQQLLALMRKVVQHVRSQRSD